MSNEEKSIDSVLLLEPPDDWVRVVKSMKPGTHLLLLCNTKKHHVSAIAAEDNGLEIRDTIAYVFADSENDVGLKLTTVARKPLEGTVAENVLRYGTGAVNVDGSRVPGSPEPTRFNPAKHSHVGWRMNATGADCAANASSLGRWPANVIHDGGYGTVKLFPITTSGGGDRNGAQKGEFPRGVGDTGSPRVFNANTGSASRFFYSAPSMDGLIAYLLKLVTPPGGTVLTDYDISKLPDKYNYVSILCPTT